MGRRKGLYWGKSPDGRDQARSELRGADQLIGKRMRGLIRMSGAAL